MRKGLTGFALPPGGVPQFEHDVEYAFSTPEPQPRQPGRHSLIDDASLHNRRDRLVQVFEGFWGEIGWNLQRVKRPDDLINVFKVMEGRVWDDFISVFWAHTIQPAISGIPAKIRLELRRLGKPIRAASEANHNVYERLQRARSALSPRLSRHERKLVRKEFVKRWKEERQVKDEYKKLDERETSLRAQLRVAEAIFTRREIFQFIKSKRYELNPLNLANATAGLPFMAWRQSMRRCSKEKSISANGTSYQVFKAIRYLVSTTKKRTAQELVECFQTSIPLLPGRHKVAKADLAEKWLFLERALRKVFKAKPHPKALPFEITMRYFRQMRTQSHTDILLAERAKLKP